MKHIVFYLLVLLQLSTTAQDSLPTGKPQVKLSINYNSNLNYYGRTDSVKSAGLFPLVEFWATPSFYMNAAPIFVVNNVQAVTYAGTVATAGYQHLSQKWLTSVYVSKPFYKKESRLVQALLKAQTGFSVSRFTSVINITAGADVKFSNQIDFGATAGIDHIFKRMAKNRAVLIFDPSVYVYAGTQRFDKTNPSKNNHVPLPGNKAQPTASRFTTLAYEVSAPLIYVKNNWMLMVTPSYVLPQHLISNPAQPEFSENGKATFYTTVGLKYTFSVKKG